MGNDTEDDAMLPDSKRQRLEPPPLTIVPKPNSAFYDRIIGGGGGPDFFPDPQPKTGEIYWNNGRISFSPVPDFESAFIDRPWYMNGSIVDNDPPIPIWHAQYADRHRRAVFGESDCTNGVLTCTERELDLPTGTQSTITTTTTVEHYRLNRNQYSETMRFFFDRAIDENEMPPLSDDKDVLPPLGVGGVYYND
jgi:hypothetical protein